jgi:16S rRNA (guanine1207-N2)-methyltransferase
MSRDALKTLFHPFDSETLVAPGEGQKVLFLGAEAGFRLPEGFAADLVCVQGFRPLYRALEAARQTALCVSEGEDYDAALILLGKHKGENEARIADALRRTMPGSIIVAAGAKEDGVQALRKRLTALGLECEHMPKYHGQAVWFARPEEIKAIALKLDSGLVSVEGRFQAGPGMFSHAAVDAGSELLASRLPTDFDGNAADFGAGWGYLSVMLAEKSPRVKTIDLYEADCASLEQAKKNLQTNCPDLHARFFWHDIAGEEVKAKYDLVIMNPPFHEGHAAEPGLGQAFIKRAADALKIGGNLLLVANRGMPYEPVIAAHFKHSGETCRNARFKVLWARK